MKKLIVKIASVGVLTASLALVSTMPAGAQQPSCQARCGMQAGQCHSGCSTNAPCHYACNVQLRVCLSHC